MDAKASAVDGVSIFSRPLSSRAIWRGPEEIPSVRIRPDLPAPQGRAPRPPAQRGPRPDHGKPRRSPTRGRSLAGEVARLFVGAGRNAGIRPQDLVGAITGEAGIPGREVGAIEIADRFSLVEVPEEVADNVIAALRASSIKGKRVIVRRERGTG